MKTTHTHATQITGLESKSSTRDCAWAFAFPMTVRHQWMRDAEFVAEPGANRLWAVLRRPISGLWRRAAERGGRLRLTLARQPQDFSDLSWALSLPASRTDGAVASAGS